MPNKTLGSLMDGRRPADSPNDSFVVDKSSKTFYNFNTLTPKRLKTILLYADNQGRLDLLYKLYDDMEVQDTRYSGIINQLKSTIAGMPLRIMEAEGRSSSEGKQAEEYAVYAREVINSLDTHSLTKEFVEPYVRGATLLTVDWQQQDLPYKRSMYFPESVEPVDGRHLIMEVSRTEDKYGEMQVRTERERGGEYISDLHYSNHIFLEDGYGKGKYSRMGVARKVLPWYLALRYMKTWWIQFNENYGSPMRVGKYPRGIKRSKRTRLRKFLKQLGQHGYGIFPEGMQVDLVEPSRAAGQFTPYKDFINKAHTEYNIHILGQAGTTGDRSDGSFAETHVLNGIRMDIMQNVASIAAKGYKKLVRKGLRLNYGDDYEEHLMPNIKPILLNSQDAKSRAQAGQIAANAGVPVPESYWYEQTLGIEKPRKGENAVVRGAMITIGEDDPSEAGVNSEQNQAASDGDENETGDTSVVNDGPGTSDSEASEDVPTIDLTR